jgi:hypothetical protein
MEKKIVSPFAACGAPPITDLIARFGAASGSSGTSGSVISAVLATFMIATIYW